MKKKLLSFGLLAAGLLTAGNVMAEDIAFTSETTSVEYTYSSTDGSIAPFDNGAIVKGTNVTALAFPQKSTSTAYFDSDASTDEAQDYDLASTDKVTIKMLAYHGYLGNTRTTTVSLKNSDGTVLVGYTYNHTTTKITSVILGGTEQISSTDDQFECNGYYTDSKSTNGFANNPYLTKEGANPTITITVSGSGGVSINFNMSLKSIDKTFSAALSNVKLDLDNISVVTTVDNDDRRYAIGSLNITKESVSEAAYTINQVCGTEILSSTSGTAEVGTTPTISTDDVWFNGVKYLYVSNDAETVGGVSESGSTVYTITYAAATEYTVTLQLQDGEGNTLANDVTGTAYAGEDITLYYPKYILKDGTYYGIDQKAEPYYGYSYTEISQDQTQTVTYTASDITYYDEFENMTASNWVASGAYPARYSNGASKRLGKSAYVTTNDVFEAGTYTIVVRGRNQSGSATGALTIAYVPSGSEDATTLAESALSWDKGATSEQSYEITLPEAGYLRFINPSTYNSNIELDYLTATKAAATTETITCNSYEYKTYCSSNALEFEEDGDLMAYTAKYTAKDGNITLTLTMCKSVPANTGVIIYNPNKVTSSDITIGEAASTTSIDNDLVGVLEATTLQQTDGDNTIFILNAEDPQEFVKVQSGTTLGANRAYLPIKTEDLTANSKVTIVFADDATGINEVNAAAKSGKIYNLQGIEVKNADKGLFIINGKKVIK